MFPYSPSLFLFHSHSWVKRQTDIHIQSYSTFSILRLLVNQGTLAIWISVWGRQLNEKSGGCVSSCHLLCNLGQSLNLHKPQFLHPCNRSDNLLSYRFRDIKYAKFLAPNIMECSINDCYYHILKLYIKSLSFKVSKFTNRNTPKIIHFFPHSPPIKPKDALHHSSLLPKQKLTWV